MARGVFHFESTTPIITPFTPTAAMEVAAWNWWDAIASPMYGSTLGVGLLYAILQDSATYHVHVHLANVTGPLHNDYLEFAYVACFTRRTAAAGRNWIGRCHFLPIPYDFVDGGQYTPAARLILQTIATNMMSTLTFDGYTFRPILWTQTLGGTAPLTSVEVVTRPCTLARRYQHRLRQVLGWQYVLKA